MISFMVIGLPRSGTAWAANWLTTEFSHCLHDALLQYRYDKLDEIPTVKRLGIADTGIARLPDFLNSHPAPKLLLYREFPAVQRSLREAGLPELRPEWEHALDKIHGLRIFWDELFMPALAKRAWEFLVPGQAFDPDRHELLKRLNVQAALEKATPSRDAVQAYLRAVREVVE